MNYKKCQHDKCRRKAVINGYCDKCIQLNTKECNFCSNSPLNVKRKTGKVNEQPKIITFKYTKWINGLDAGTSYFNSIFLLGKYLFFIVVFLTCIVVWAILLTLSASEILLGFSNFMLLMFRLIFMMIVFGLTFKYFCMYLSSFLKMREGKLVLQEGVKKYVSK